MSDEGSAFDRLTRQIAELDAREAALAGVPDLDGEMELAGLREQRNALTQELEDLWARRTNHCCGDE